MVLEAKHVENMRHECFSPPLTCERNKTDDNILNADLELKQNENEIEAKP